jgi:metal-dependent amidase/aminoacylase/carboxypeptidase family protein
MREHIEPTARLHYIYEIAGVAPNVVPDEARIWIQARDITTPRVNAIADWLSQLAAGAALGTQTKATFQVVVEQLIVGRIGNPSGKIGTDYQSVLHEIAQRSGQHHDEHDRRFGPRSGERPTDRVWQRQHTCAHQFHRSGADTSPQAPRPNRHVKPTASQ